MTDIELICLYIQNNLSESEKVEFERRLKNEPKLMEEFKFQKELREALLDEDVMELREQFRTIGNNKCSGQSEWRKMRIWGMAMISGFLLIVLLLSGVYQFGIGSYDNEEIFNKYFKPYQSVVSVRSQESVNNKLVNKAFSHYSTGKWQKSEEYLKKLILQEPNNAMYRFYLGVVELELGNTKSSIQAFNETLQKDNTLFTEQAYWYSALAYLKSGELEEAGKKFEWIVEKQGYHYQEARDILKSIDRGIFSW